MSDIAIKVENLSKMYRLGDVGTGSLGTDITSWWAKVRGKEDPNSKIAVANDRSQKATSDFVWSLQNIDFEIKRGDAVGIIGKNGAGKSTLLKILSRTTTPTTGSIKIKGRVAALLEVGTGFHGDLSGKENIYMNGAILGMTRREISSKLEEIIEFSGVSGYIDTPVKRYSSGMYVRLAFAVAAHLDPEIMIVDEVLAVGDAEFQKKCLGKMQDVNNKEGRTVLFVSHQMQAITQLCNKTILLKNGQLVFNGSVSDAVSMYFDKHRENASTYNLIDEPRLAKFDLALLKSLSFFENKSKVIKLIKHGDILSFEITYAIHKLIPKFNIAIGVTNAEGTRIFSENLGDYYKITSKPSGEYATSVSLNTKYLKIDMYYLTIVLLDGTSTLDMVENIPFPEIKAEDADVYMESKRWGIVRIPTAWSEA